MSHYVKPAIYKKSKQEILHSGTSNIANNSPDKKVSDIIFLAKKNVHENIPSGAISAIFPRRWPVNKKEKKGNEKLKEFYSEKNFYFTPHNNINLNIHTNRRGLHLNSINLGKIISDFVNVL